MIYVGIDIAKHNHYCAITTNYGEVLYSPFLVKNDYSSFKELETILSQFEKSEILIGFESTAHYANNLSSYFSSRDFNCGIINPYRTAQLRKVLNPDTKNDKVDALLICQALQMKLHTPIRYHLLMDELKGLCISYQNIMTSRSRSKIQLTTYVDRVFRELAAFFKGNLHLKVSYELLKHYPLPSNISKARIDTLTNLLSTASHGRYKADKAVSLKNLSKNSIGINSSSVGFQIQLAISQIELYTNQLEEIKSRITAMMIEIDSPLLSISGINTIMAALILSSIKDITLFSNWCKLCSFAGLNPKVVQSGHFSASTTRMSKRGNRMLRYALIYSAHNVVKNNQTFKEYYTLKRSQGKSHYNALGHCATKLIRIIYKLLNENKKFDLA